MPTITWTGGAGDGKWATTGNWSSNSVPVTGDDVRIELGSDAITAGLSQGAVNLASLRISFNGTIGSTSTPLTIGCNSGSVIVTGTGSQYKIAAGTGGISRLIFNPKSFSTLFLAGGTTSSLELATSGMCEVDASAVVTTLYTTGCGVAIAYNATAITTLQNTRANVSSYRNITTANTGPSAITATLLTAAITTSNVSPMGRLNHKSSGTIGSSVVQPFGMADAYGSTYQFTVTNRTNYASYTRNFDVSETAKVTFTNVASTIATEINY